jgi:hypothetical protein
MLVPDYQLVSKNLRIEVDQNQIFLSANGNLRIHDVG